MLILIKIPVYHNISFLKCGRRRWIDSAWTGLHTASPSLISSRYKPMDNQKPYSWHPKCSISQRMSKGSRPLWFPRVWGDYSAPPSTAHTSSGSAAEGTFCRQQWWFGSEHTRVLCFHRTKRRGCDTEEKYLGKSTDYENTRGAHRVIYLQSTTYSETRNSPIPKEPWAYTQPRAVWQLKS